MKRATSGLHVFYLYVLQFFFRNLRCEAPSQKTLCIMKKNDFIKYEAPEVEILEVMVEKGFAASPGDDQLENPDSGGDL